MVTESLKRPTLKRSLGSFSAISSSNRRRTEFDLCRKKETFHRLSLCLQLLVLLFSQDCLSCIFNHPKSNVVLISVAALTMWISVETLNLHEQANWFSPPNCLALWCTSCPQKLFYWHQGILVTDYGHEMAGQR